MRWSMPEEGQWNEIEMRVEGYTFTNMINGQIMSICTDNNKQVRRDKGLLAIHLRYWGIDNPTKSPAVVEIKNIRIKKLDK